MANRASGLTILSTSAHIANLTVEVLGDRLDHEVAVRKRPVVGRPLDPAADRVGVFLARLALLDRAGELLLDLADALGQNRVVDLAHDDCVARPRPSPE